MDTVRGLPGYPCDPSKTLNRNRVPTPHDSRASCGLRREHRRGDADAPSISLPDVKRKMLGYMQFNILCGFRRPASREYCNIAALFPLFFALKLLLAHNHRAQLESHSCAHLTPACRQARRDAARACGVCLIWHRPPACLQPSRPRRCSRRLMTHPATISPLQISFVPMYHAHRRRSASPATFAHLTRHWCIARFVTT